MDFHVREAVTEDLPRLVQLLDQLSLEGESREDLSRPLNSAYRAALARISADDRQRQLVVEAGRELIATAALVIIPNLSHVGKPYAIVEDVVVDAAWRSKGVGEALLRHMVDLARQAGCYKVCLTSNKARADAHRFYRRLGFRASHEGFRMDLDA